MCVGQGGSSFQKPKQTDRGSPRGDVTPGLDTADGEAEQDQVGGNSLRISVSSSCNGYEQMTRLRVHSCAQLSTLTRVCQAP